VLPDGTKTCAKGRIQSDVLRQNVKTMATFHQAEIIVSKKHCFIIMLQSSFTSHWRVRQRSGYCYLPAFNSSYQVFAPRDVFRLTAASKKDQIFHNARAMFKSGKSYARPICLASLFSIGHFLFFRREETPISRVGEFSSGPPHNFVLFCQPVTPD
jgi:hypothetical protein